MTHRITIIQKLISLKLHKYPHWGILSTYVQIPFEILVFLMDSSLIFNN